MQVIPNDVIKCCKMMSSNVVLLHSNNCCVVLEPAICEDLDLHVAIFSRVCENKWSIFPFYFYGLYCRDLVALMLFGRNEGIPLS